MYTAAAAVSGICAHHVKVLPFLSQLSQLRKFSCTAVRYAATLACKVVHNEYSSRGEVDIIQTRPQTNRARRTAGRPTDSASTKQAGLLYHATHHQVKNNGHIILILVKCVL